MSYRKPGIVKQPIIWGLFITIIIATLVALQVRSKPSATSRSYGQEIVALTFHSIKDSPEPGNNAVMTASELEETFRLLREEGYHPVSLNQFHDFLEGKGLTPARSVLLTFDDGYEDLVKKVAPLVAKYNFPAVSFPVFKWFQPHPRLDQERDRNLPYRQHLSRDQVKELQRSGLWAFGGHSYDGHWYIPVAEKKSSPFLIGRMWLPELNRIETEGEYRARVWSDILLMRNTSRELGLESVDFAYPYGALNQDLIYMLQEAGYKYLFSLQPGLNRPGQDLARIPRYAAATSAKENLDILKEAFRNR